MIQNVQNIYLAELIQDDESDLPDEKSIDAKDFNDYEMMETAKGDNEEDIESPEEPVDDGLFDGFELIEETFDDVIFSIDSEEVPSDHDTNQVHAFHFLFSVETYYCHLLFFQFESVKSTLSINLGNITTDIVEKYQLANFSCFVNSQSDELFAPEEVIHFKTVSLQVKSTTISFS